MDITAIVEAIEKDVSARNSNKFGIKVGGELYKALAQTGKITKAAFSWRGVGIYAQELAAYDGKYYIFHDWELRDYDFEVGTPVS